MPVAVTSSSGTPKLRNLSRSAGKSAFVPFLRYPTDTGRAPDRDCTFCQRSVLIHDGGKLICQ